MIHYFMKSQPRWGNMGRPWLSWQVPSSEASHGAVRAPPAGRSASVLECHPYVCWSNTRWVCRWFRGLTCIQRVHLDTAIAVKMHLKKNKYSAQYMNKDQLNCSAPCPQTVQHWEIVIWRQGYSWLIVISSAHRLWCWKRESLLHHVCQV